MKSLRATTAKTKNIWFLRGEPTGRCYFFLFLKFLMRMSAARPLIFSSLCIWRFSFSSLIILRFSIFQHKKLKPFFCGDARHWPFGDPSGTYTSFHFFILQLTFLIFFFYIFTIFLLIQFCTFLVLFFFLCHSILLHALSKTQLEWVIPSLPLPPLPLHNFKTLEWNNLHHDIFHLKLGRPRLYSPLGFSRSHPFHIKRWYQRYKKLGNFLYFVILMLFNLI